jgi:uncharacterized protein (TIGR03437 family)
MGRKILVFFCLFLPLAGRAQPPTVPPNSIVNNASYTPGSGPLAPGSIAAIFGSNLTDGTSCLPPSCNPSFGTDGKLATTMAGAQVTVNGTPAPIFYATPGQLGIQIPAELTGSSATVQVTVGGQASSPQVVALSAVSPGVFTFNANGQGAAALLHVDGSPVSALRPAQTDELVILYATGLGQTTPAVATGSLPAAPSKAAAAISVIIGGLSITPDFAGRSGCCVGLDQINFHVPSGMTAGNMSLSLSSPTGIGSNQTLAAVQPPDVVQHHRSVTRNGLYIDPLMTALAAAQTHLDSTFQATLPGPTYAQPLYLSNGPGGVAALLVVTEQNQVLALSASSGSQIWTKSLGSPVPLAQLPCGNIDPLGITGTPVVDTAARIVYVAAMTTPDSGVTKQHRIFALSLDSGSVLSGWPLDLNGLTYSGATFTSPVQNQRGALLLNAGTLYVPYGGNDGDCGNYHGWVVAVPVNNPKAATAWATGAQGGGSWGPGGVAAAADGQFVFAATGNTFGASTWMGGEAVIRLSAGAVFSGNATDYFTPSNWQALDAGDTDVGGSGPILIDVPGAVPSQLAVALGKNGVAYLLDRNLLGGIGKGNGTTGEGIQSKQVANNVIINAAAAYTAASGSYVVFTTSGTGVGCPGTAGNLVALRISSSTPPTINVAWCANGSGRGSPIVTTDGISQPIVWTVGAESSNRLYAFDGQTGQMLFNGGGANEQMTLVRRTQTPINVNGRIFVAADNQLYAFTTQ